jgi:hypothetical protein
MCKHFILQVLWQQIKLTVKVIMKDYGPVHRLIMLLKPYGFKCIFQARFLVAALRAPRARAGRERRVARPHSSPFRP